MGELPKTLQDIPTLREIERRHILYVVDLANGNRTHAAQVLGISLRCLQYKLKEYLGGQEGQGVLQAEPETCSPTHPSPLHYTRRTELSDIAGA